MISIDKTACLRCQACVKDCVAGVLGLDADGYPTVLSGGASRCLRCQHCLAICPVGCVSFQGVSGRSLPGCGALPAPDEMLNLLRQRRSIRQYADENLSRQELDRLESCLRWSPTGCNDHSLHFSVIEDKVEMAFMRQELIRVLRKLRFWGVFRFLYPRYRSGVDAVIGGADLVFRGAPHLIAASVPPSAPCAEADPWISLSYFDLLAQSMGVGTCWCGFGVHAIGRIRRMREHLGIPAGYRVGAVLLFGRPAVRYPRGTDPVAFPVHRVGVSGA